MPQTGDVDALIVAVRDQPAGTPGRGVLAAAAIGAVLQSGSVEPGRMRQLAPLLAIADQDPPAGAEWPALRAVTRATVLTWDAAERRLPDPRAALAEVRALAAEHRDSRFAPLFASSELALRYAAGVAEGDVAHWPTRSAGFARSGRIRWSPRTRSPIRRSTWWRRRPQW